MKYETLSKVLLSPSCALNCTGNYHVCDVYAYKLYALAALVQIILLLSQSKIDILIVFPLK